jgi:hypothetical protein
LVFLASQCLEHRKTQIVLSIHRYRFQLIENIPTSASWSFPNGAATGSFDLVAIALDGDDAVQWSGLLTLQSRARAAGPDQQLTANRSRALLQREAKRNVVRRPGVNFRSPVILEGLSGCRNNLKAVAR